MVGSCYCYHYYFLFLVFCFNSLKEVYSIKHSEGLNKWSFLSNKEHDLYSDLLCPNPMVGGITENRVQSSRVPPLNHSAAGTILMNDGVRPNSPVATDIWAFKTRSEMTFLPCDLKTNPYLPNNYGQQVNRNATNKILFLNVTLFPFDFEGSRAKLCTRFIKLQFDEEEGVELGCNENPVGPESLNHISWPRDPQKRKKSFSLFRNLERFLRNEESFRKKFYFQIYFTSVSGRTKKCTVQQYELNLSNPGCNARRPPRIEDVCGEYSCDDRVFPFLGDVAADGKPPVFYPPEAGSGKPKYFFNKRLDTRLVVFLVIVPLVIIGMLIFALEVIIYITCLRRSPSSGRRQGDAVLQNSLNIWESNPNRESTRSVSFSPVTTNITGSESPLPDSVSTPRVLKSVLKKSTEHLPPPPPHFYDTLEREYPPTYYPHPPPYGEAIKHQGP